jgi:FAD:protein FMN transferase
LRKVGHYSLSQILVPDEGWPVEFAPSLIVRATSAIEAGVMSSALLVVPAYQALADANQNTGVEVLTITETGKFFASREWYADDEKKSTERNPWPEGMKFQVEFEIPALDVAEYRRPYVAIWINDTAGQAVQSLLVAGDSARWLRELRQWWRKLGRGDDSLIDATAGATRKPGRYKLEWDGRNFQGQKIAAGSYELHVEIAREHGEHEHLVLPFSVDGKPIRIKQRGKQEIGVVTLTLR